MNSNSALTITSSRRQALKLMGGGLIGGLALATGNNAATAQRGSQRGPTGGPGSLVNEITPTEYATGEYLDVVEITRFSGKGGQLTASGNVYEGETFLSTFSAPVESLRVTDAEGNDVTGHMRTEELASVATGRASDVSLAQTEGDCQILFLELGPLTLDVLGLVVTIPDPIVLDITAVPGAGNLLGNLLCAVAGLLDPASPLEGLVGQLVGLLNQILGALGG